MAGIKIVDLPPLGRDLLSTDLLELSIGGTASRKITGQEIMNASKLSVGSTPIISGTVGRLLFQGTGDVLQQSSGLFYDPATVRFGLNTSTPAYTLDVNGTTRFQYDILANSRMDMYGTIYMYNNITSLSGNIWLSNGYAIGDYATGNNRIEFYNTRLSFIGNGNEALRIVGSTGNLLVNTTTDAGYKLDVNGTARVSGNGTFGITATRILTIRPEDTTGAYGNSCSIRGGNGNGRLDFYSATNITELRDNIILLTSGTGPSLQVGSSSINLNVASSTRLQVAATTGNVLINTTTDAGYRLDVNGTARISGQLTVGPNPGNFLQTGGSTAVWFSDASNPLRITLVQSLINLNNAGDFSIHRTMSSARGVISTNPETFNLAVEGYSRVDGIFNRNLSNINKSIFYASTNGGGSVTNAPILRYFHAVKGNVTGYTNYRGIEIEDLDSFFGTTSGSVGIGVNTSINASAILDITSTTKGFLPPRMTNAQRAAIASPAVGLIVYCTDATEGLYVYKSTGWTFMV
jgi:hypothetical protein